MKLNPFNKPTTWNQTLADLHDRAAQVRQEKDDVAVRRRELALPAETGDTAAAGEMAKLLRKEAELGVRLATLDDAIAGVYVELDREAAESKRQAEEAHRQAVRDCELRLDALIDAADLALGAAGKAVAALIKEAEDLQKLGGRHNLNDFFMRERFLYSALRFHGFTETQRFIPSQLREASLADHLRRPHSLIDGEAETALEAAEA